jgi:hypothetical protein
MVPTVGPPQPPVPQPVSQQLSQQSLWCRRNSPRQRARKPCRSSQQLSQVLQVLQVLQELWPCRRWPCPLEQQLVVQLLVQQLVEQLSQQSQLL